MAKSSLSGKVVKMLHQPFENVLQSRIRTLAINRLDILGDVVNGEILHRRNRYFRWIHGAESAESSKMDVSLKLRGNGGECLAVRLSKGTIFEL